RHRAARRRHHVEVRGGAVVVGLRRAIGEEVDARAVGAPGEVGLVERAAGQLLRLRQFRVCRGGDGDGPDVRLARSVRVTGGVVAIDGLIDDADVADALV